MKSLHADLCWTVSITALVNITADTVIFQPFVSLCLNPCCKYHSYIQNLPSFPVLLPDSMLIYSLTVNTLDDNDVVTPR